ncbi:hypothetical protein acdb102_23740 [Acidothermaceae bacterium B102]|nr:hypothetical protein acdb102_23740 [Acidothermaceae bacterium B102]
MISAFDVVARHRVVPVIVADDVEIAAELADTLVTAGLPLAEVTFRTPAAEGVLRAMAANGSLLVGAGTVLTPEQVDRAVDAGARFIVSPGISRPVVERALQFAIPIIPGVATASDLMLAAALGLSVVKFFPAFTLGGLPALKALAAPFPGMTFVPTGGVTPQTLPDYLDTKAVLAVGGTWITPADLLARRQFAEIRQRAADAVSIAARPKP